MPTVSGTGCRIDHTFAGEERRRAFSGPAALTMRVPGCDLLPVRTALLVPTERHLRYRLSRRSLIFMRLSSASVRAM